MANTSTTSNASLPTTGRCLYEVLHNRSLNEPHNMYNFIIFFPLALLFGFIGLLGNTFAYIFIGLEKPNTSTSVLLRSLALVDNLVLIGYIFVRTLICLPDYFDVFEEYIEFYELSFRYFWTFRWFTKTMSIYITICVAAERYIAVRRPLRVASICTIRNARIAVAVVAILSFAFQSPTLLYIDTFYTYDECTGGYRPNWKYSAIGKNRYYKVLYTNLFSMLLMAVFPMVTLTFFAHSLISALKEAAKRSGLSRETQTGGDKKRPDRTKTVTVRVTAIVVVFVVLELPSNIWQIADILEEYDLIQLTNIEYDYVQNFTYFLGYLNSVCNFYVYCLLGRRFRMSFMKAFSKVHPTTR
ncbi:G-protein coupled receptor daf-37-like [Lineus longissimus]|uniref:G-protein coupled receptor daf-37-like n=1 Tax=Lineus longissimus TaxID=88925 RepID=UPI00315DA622